MKGQSGALAAFGRGSERHRPDLEKLRLDPASDETVLPQFLLRRQLRRGRIVVAVTVDAICEFGGRDGKLRRSRQRRHGRAVIGRLGEERPDIDALLRHRIP